MDPQKYPNVPSVIWSYYNQLTVKDPSHPLCKAISKQGEDKTWGRIDKLFRITSQNTNLEPERLLRQLGFDEKNLDGNHLQAIFGVMRSVNTLDALGFDKISPLRAAKSRRESDLIAEYIGTRFAVEVFRSSEAAYRFPQHNNPVHDLERYIARRFNEKRSQLEATMKTHKCRKALLVVVMDSSPARQLTENDEWHGIVKNAYREMGNPPDTHLLLFTGLSDSQTGTDERTVYPELDC